MINFYTNMQATAYRLLKGKGQFITISRNSAGAYDPTLGQAAITITTQTGWGTIFEYQNQNIDGTLVLKGDKQLLLSAINAAGTALMTPQINDTVTIGGIVHTIMQIKPLSPAGITVLFDVNLRA
ncbi:MAG: hypothetical protein QMD11_07945 [Smithella sp.]|nr:hypothetical protein [Smithella sp.]